MAQVTYIKSETEIPEHEKFVLVRFGPENNTIRHSRGITVLVKRGQNPPNQLELMAFYTAVDGMKGTADREGIATIYAEGSPNSGKPWSDDEICQLEYRFGLGLLLSDIAEELGRDLDEVTTKARARGLIESGAP